jgi:hypothetical protein
MNEGLKLKILVLSGIYAGYAFPDSEVTQVHHRAFGRKAGKLELGNGVLSPPIMNF